MIRKNVLYQALTVPIRLLEAGNIDQQGHEMKALTRITFNENQESTCWKIIDCHDALKTAGKW
jgi:hypothetical protein